MVIATTSTVMNIRTTGAAPVTATAIDIALWSAITLPATITTYQTTKFYTGLFGYDLTAFFAYCVTSTSCDDVAYNASYFDGWSIGGNIALSTWTNAYQVDLLLGMCLESQYACFGVSTSATASTSAVDDGWNNLFTA